MNKNNEIIIRGARVNNLKNIDVNVPRNKFVVITGLSGSGKSSLMSLLLRFYDLKPDIDMGQIMIDGEDISTHPKRTYRKHLGIILQDPVIFKGTIADNIRFGEKDVSDERVEEVLRMIGGGRIIDKLPEGVRQAVTRGGGNLSVGEKQLISFARALAFNSEIIIMDEATASIDPQTEAKIQRTMQKVFSGKTAVVVAHRLTSVLDADEILYFNKGEISARGSHTELMKISEDYRKLVELQLVGENHE